MSAKKGHIVSEETRNKISKSLYHHKVSASVREKMSMVGKPNSKGEKNRSWKGKEAGYGSIHEWVSRWKGKPSTCEWCGKKNLFGHQIQWANIDHKYLRILDDYIRLCAKCHDFYDVSHGFRNHKIRNNGWFKNKI